VKLKNAVQFRAGGTPDTGNESFWANGDDGTPWVAIGDMSGGPIVSTTAKRLTPEGLAARGLAPGSSGTVLFAMYASVGAVATLNIDAVWNQAILGMTPNHDTDGRFVAYWLRHYGPQAVADARSATQANLNADQVANFPFPDWKIEEQRRIADFLDDRVARIDQIISARREQVDLVDRHSLESVRLGVAGILDLDGQGIESAIPWISRMSADARVAQLARVVTLQRGVDLTAEEQRPGDVPVVTTAGVVGTHDVAIAKGPGVVIGRYGSVGSVHWIEHDYWPHNTTLYVRNAQGHNLRWIYYLLRSFPYGAMQARAAVPGVNRNDMATEDVPVIPRILQNRVAAVLDERTAETATQVGYLSHSIDLFSQYKQSLITAAVTGELDVTTAGSGIPG